MLEALRGVRSHTLGGVIGVCRKGEIWLAREPGAGSGDAEKLCGQWRVTRLQPGEELRALGADGLAQIEDWRDLGLPREALLTLPSIWSGERLLWTPFLAGHDACEDQRGAELIRPSFMKSLEGH
jgi:tRNA(Ile)-lysidine synthase